MKKAIAAALVGVVALTACGGGDNQRQVSQCVSRLNGAETVIALDVCQQAYDRGTTDSSFGETFLVYMLLSNAMDYPSIGSPFVGYGRYNYVSPTNVTIVNNYGGISATPKAAPKTSPLKSSSAATSGATKAQPPKAPKTTTPKAKASEPPKTSTVPKVDPKSAPKLPEPAKPQTATPKPAPAPKPAPVPKPAAPKPAAPKPASPSKK